MIEGLIVYIQSLRLHLYEFFTKWYEGGAEPFKQINKIPSYLVFIHICYDIVLITIFAFLLRTIIRKIPFLFDGYMGYKHSSLSELNGTVLLTFSLITYVSQDLDDKVRELLRRFNIKEKKIAK